MATIGIDVGGTKCLGVVLESGQVVARYRIPTPGGGPGLVAALSAMVEILIQRAWADGVHGIEAVGVGLPGLVDRHGFLEVAPNLSGSRGVNLPDQLSTLVNLPVVVDNDATCATWAEFRAGAAQTAASALVITLGTGIGAGIVAGGRLVRGAHGFAGEIGHMVVDPDGQQCPCGRQGCWERFASGSAMARTARIKADAGGAQAIVAIAGNIESIRGEHVGVAAAAGDPDAIDLVESLAGWVALGLANLVSILDPDLIVIGGGMGAMGELLLAPTRRELNRIIQIVDGRSEAVTLVAAQLGEMAGAMGAALLAQERAGADGRIH